MSKDSVVKFQLKDDPLEYHLRFDVNVQADVERETGLNLMRFIVGGNVSLTDTRGMLYALLKPIHSDVTLPECGALLSRDLDAVMTAMSLVLEAPRGIVPEALKPPAPPAGIPADAGVPMEDNTYPESPAQ